MAHHENSTLQIGRNQMSSKFLYRERIWPGAGFASFLLFMGASLAIAYQRAYHGNIGIAIICICALLTSAITFASAPLLEISLTEMRLGKAHIDRVHLGKTAILDSVQTKQALGKGAHAGALAVTRSGIKATIIVEILDENDPHPYWIFSTRRPQLVLKALGSSAAETSA
jgi:hypothetical protein